MDTYKVLLCHESSSKEVLYHRKGLLVCPLKHYIMNDLPFESHGNINSVCNNTNSYSCEIRSSTALPNFELMNHDSLHVKLQSIERF